MSFAQGLHNQGVVRVSHKVRTSLEQLSSEGHIFLISAPNRTRFVKRDEEGVGSSLSHG